MVVTKESSVKEITTAEQLYEAMLKIRGIPETPQSVRFTCRSFRVVNTSPVGLKQPLRTATYEDIAGNKVDITGTSGSFEPIENYDPTVVKHNYNATLVPTHYTYLVNGVPITLSHGMRTQQVSNGHGGVTVELVHTDASQINIDPYYDIPDTRRQMNLTMVLVLHPYSNYSPMTLTNEEMAAHGLFVEMAGNNGGVRYRHLYNVTTLDEIARRKSDARSIPDMREVHKYIQAKFDESPLAFQMFCKKLGIKEYSGPDASDYAYSDVMSMSSTSEGRSKIMDALLDKSMTARITVTEAISLGLVELDGNGWRYAVGSRSMTMDCGASEEELVSHVASNKQLMYNMQLQIRLKKNRDTVAEELDSKYRKIISLARDAVNRGYKEDPNGDNLKPGCIYFDGKKNWINHQGTTIVFAGARKGGTEPSAEEREAILDSKMKDKVDRMGEEEAVAWFNKNIGEWKE